MQLYILSEFPIESADILISNMKPAYCHTMLKELCQMISSVLGGKELNSLLDKKIPQGKEFQKFIKDNPLWINRYGLRLLSHCKDTVKLKDCTKFKYEYILGELSKLGESTLKVPDKAPFRYSKEYECDIQTNTVLPLQETITQYKRYLAWKQKGKGE